MVMQMVLSLLMPHEIHPFQLSRCKHFLVLNWHLKSKTAENHQHIVPLPFIQTPGRQSALNKNRRNMLTADQNENGSVVSSLSSLPYNPRWRKEIHVSDMHVNCLAHYSPAF